MSHPSQRPRSSTLPAKPASKPRFSGGHSFSEGQDPLEWTNLSINSNPPKDRPSPSRSSSQRPTSPPDQRRPAAESQQSTPRAGPVRSHTHAQRERGHPPPAPAAPPAHGASKTNRANSPSLTVPPRHKQRPASPPKAPRVPSRSPGASANNRTPPSVPQKPGGNRHSPHRSGATHPPSQKPAPHHAAPAANQRRPTPPNRNPTPPGSRGQHPEEIDRDSTPRHLSNTRRAPTPPKQVPNRPTAETQQQQQQKQQQAAAVPDWQQQYYAYMKEKEEQDRRKEEEEEAAKKEEEEAKKQQQQQQESKAIVETTSVAPVRQQTQVIEAKQQEEQQAQESEERRTQQTQQHKQSEPSASSSSGDPNANAQSQKQTSAVVVESSWQTSNAEAMTYISVIQKPSSHDSTAPPKLLRLTLRGDTDDVTVESLKEALSEFCGLPVDQQRLTKDGLVLTNRMLGVEFGLRPGAVLYLDTIAASPDRSRSKEPQTEGEKPKKEGKDVTNRETGPGTKDAERSASTASRVSVSNPNNASQFVTKALFLCDGAKTKTVDEFEFKLDLEAQLEEMRSLELSIARQKEALAQRRRIFSRLQREREERLAKEEAAKREELRKLRVQRTKMAHENSRQSSTYRSGGGVGGSRGGSSSWAPPHVDDDYYSGEDYAEEEDYYYYAEDPLQHYDGVDTEDPYRRVLPSRRFSTFQQQGQRTTRSTSRDRLTRHDTNRRHRPATTTHQHQPPQQGGIRALTSPQASSPHIQHSSYKPARQRQAFNDVDDVEGGDAVEWVEDDDMVIDLSQEPQPRPLRQPQYGGGSRRHESSPTRALYTTHAPLQSPFRD